MARPEWVTYSDEEIEEMISEAKEEGTYEEMKEENTGFWQRGTTMFCDSKLIEESQREMRELASVEARIQELKNIPQKAEEKKGVFKRLFGRYF